MGDNQTFHAVFTTWEQFWHFTGNSSRRGTLILARVTKWEIASSKLASCQEESRRETPGGKRLSLVSRNRILVLLKVLPVVRFLLEFGPVY